MVSPWWHQHAELDDLVQALTEALQRGEGARAAFAELAQVLDAHFALEEMVYFGLVQRLRPDLEPGIAQARVAHAALRAVIRRLGECLAVNERAHAESLTAELLAAFAEHERLESRLVRALAERLPAV